MLSYPLLNPTDLDEKFFKELILIIQWNFAIFDSKKNSLLEVG